MVFKIDLIKQINGEEILLEKYFDSEVNMFIEQNTNVCNLNIINSEELNILCVQVKESSE